MKSVPEVLRIAHKSIALWENPGFYSQHMHDGLQLSIAPVPGDPMAPLWLLRAPGTHVVHKQMWRQNPHTHFFKNVNIKVVLSPHSLGSVWGGDRRQAHSWHEPFPFAGFSPVLSLLGSLSPVPPSPPLPRLPASGPQGSTSEQLVWGHILSSSLSLFGALDARPVAASSNAMAIVTAVIMVVETIWCVIFRYHIL